jgi:hypothetical protein
MSNRAEKLLPQQAIAPLSPGVSIAKEKTITSLAGLVE